MNRVGRSAGIERANILPTLTKKNQKVLKLDSDRDMKVSDDDPELVLLRQTAGGDWQWSPLTEMTELKNFFNTASIEEKSHHLGLWQDQPRAFGWLPGDGQIQESEVTTMAERWNTPQPTLSETEYNHDKGYTQAWYEHRSAVKADKVTLEDQKLVTGEVVVLKEPRKVVETEVERVTDWHLTCDGWRPCDTEVEVYDKKARQRCGGTTRHRGSPD